MDEIGKALQLGAWLALFAYMLSLAGPGAVPYFAPAALIIFIVSVTTRD